MPSSDTFQQINSDINLNSLYQALHKYGKDKPVLIAYSGGVDSSLLCDIMQEYRKGNMIALLLTGPFIPQHEIEKAKLFAHERGFPLLIHEYNILSFPDIAKNTKERCAFCKQHMANLLWKIAEEQGCSTIVDGVCASDIDEYRPGIEVSTKAGIKHPFLEAGITKSDIRAIAKKRGLALWNKPSSACLASRIPYDTPLTAEILKRAEWSETYLHKRGFSPVRVRIHDMIARIEIIPEQFQMLIEMRTEIISAFREFGFLYITLDMQGYRTGSMDETYLSDGQ